jgi:hypothetical protein
MRRVNQHLVKRALKFEGLSDIAGMAEKVDYSAAYDFNSGYYQVPLHSNLHRFVGFEQKGKYYKNICLLFGLSTAPWVFSKGIRELVIFWRAKRENPSFLTIFFSS